MPSKPLRPEIARTRALVRSLKSAGFTVTHDARATKKSLAGAALELGFELPDEVAAYFRAFGGIYVGGGQHPLNFYSLDAALLRTSEYRLTFDEFRNEQSDEGLPDKFIVIVDSGTFSNSAEGVVYDAVHEKLWGTDGGRYGADVGDDEGTIWELVERELEDLLAKGVAEGDGAEAGYEPDLGAICDELDRVEAKHKATAMALTSTFTRTRARTITKWADGFEYHESLTAEERSTIAPFLARLGAASDQASVVLGRSATIADRYALHSEFKTLAEFDDLVRAIPSDDIADRQQRLDGLLARPSHGSWEELVMLLASWLEPSRREAIAAAEAVLASWETRFRSPNRLLMGQADLSALAHTPALGEEITFDRSFELEQVLALPGCRSLQVRNTKVAAADLERLASSALPLESVDLYNAGLTSDMGPTFAQLGAAKPIATLKLPFNDLGPKGTQGMFPRASPAWGHLRELDLSANEIGNPGAKALAQSHLPALRSLTIHHNPGVKKGSITDIGAAHLASSVELANLEVVDLHCQGLTAVGAAALIASRQLSSLRDLRLGGFLQLASLVAGCKDAEPHLTSLAIWRAHGEAPAPDWTQARFLQTLLKLKIGVTIAELCGLLKSAQLISLKCLHIDYAIEESEMAWPALVESTPPPGLRFLDVASLEPTPEQAKALVQSAWGAQLEGIVVSHYISPKTWAVLYEGGLLGDSASEYL
ncbi:MAG: hypothetical protein H0T65_09200 [Deltaproteobacteria bacterium]|nr:hypothetical protein [Deltaproteobacteria bacterium]